MATFAQKLVALVARVLLSQIFLMAAITHLSNWPGAIGSMKGQGMALEGILSGAVSVVFLHVMLALAILFLLAGGLSVLLGIRARLGAVLLIVFLLLVTPIFHNFWAYSAGDMQRVMQQGNFMKNAAIGGGLLMVLAFGSGGIGLDPIVRRRRRPSKEEPVSAKS